MAATHPTFPAGAYVVTFRKWRLLGTASGFVAWTAITSYAFASAQEVLTHVVVAVVEVVLAFVFWNDLTRVVRREVAFAVHPGGVYFGSNSVKDDVPWSQISAVELFIEIHQTAQARNSSRCIGVRSLGTAQPIRRGNGPAARPWPERSVQYMIAAGRADLLPGADGTIRFAYREMSGWRVDRASLAEALSRYAPAVPIIDGPQWPPQLSRAEAFAARRRRGSWW